jgi:CBS-domain-containing membrane protein
MSAEVKYCFEDEDLDHVVSNLGDLRIRRLPVMNRDKRLVGIVSLGDFAKGKPKKATAEALAEISQPGGPHSQSARAQH